jgi:hypothetical protein
MGDNQMYSSNPGIYGSFGGVTGMYGSIPGAPMSYGGKSTCSCDTRSLDETGPAGEMAPERGAKWRAADRVGVGRDVGAVLRLCRWAGPEATDF